VLGEVKERYETGRGNKAVGGLGMSRDEKTTRMAAQLLPVNRHRPAKAVSRLLNGSNPSEYMI